MEFKIFRAGFTEAEFNAFLSDHIILKDKYLENGDVYVFFKHKSKIGSDPISEIEVIDRMVTRAEQDILTSRLDITDIDTKLADIEEKIKSVHPNQKKEWDGLQKAKKDLEGQKTLAEKTIAGSETTILNLKAAHQELLNNSK